MHVKKITEVTIYESPDGGKTVYSRTNGSTMRELHSISAEMESEIERVRRQDSWMAILKMSERSPALQEAVDRAIVLYELSKTDDDTPLMWHPV
jgi:hypothetical protein